MNVIVESYWFFKLKRNSILFPVTSWLRTNSFLLIICHSNYFMEWYIWLHITSNYTNYMRYIKYYQTTANVAHGAPKQFSLLQWPRPKAAATLLICSPSFTAVIYFQWSQRRPLICVCWFKCGYPSGFVRIFFKSSDRCLPVHIQLVHLLPCMWYVAINFCTSQWLSDQCGRMNYLRGKMWMEQRDVSEQISFQTTGRVRRSIPKDPMAAGSIFN